MVTCCRCFWSLHCLFPSILFLLEMISLLISLAIISLSLASIATVFVSLLPLNISLSKSQFTGTSCLIRFFKRASFTNEGWKSIFNPSIMHILVKILEFDHKLSHYLIKVKGSYSSTRSVIIAFFRTLDIKQWYISKGSQASITNLPTFISGLVGGGYFTMFHIFSLVFLYRTRAKFLLDCWDCSTCMCLK